MDILFYDTETTGLPRRSGSFSHPDQPFVAQLAYLLERDGETVEAQDVLVKPYDKTWIMSPESLAIHGKTPEMCEEQGITLPEMMDLFVDACFDVDVLVCHNVSFDSILMMIQATKLDPKIYAKSIFEGRPHVCSMLAAMPVCKLPKKKPIGGKWKWPTLQETHTFLFGHGFDGAHDAMADILATQRCFHELCNRGALDEPFANVGLVAPRYEAAASQEVPHNG